MNNNVSKMVLTIVFLIFGSGAFAADAWVSGKITQTLVTDNSHGKCMIFLPNFANFSNCPAQWISLDCAGSFGPKEDARRFWDTAQMAYALDSSVDVLVTDSYKHNGYCKVKMIVVKK